MKKVKTLSKKELAAKIRITRKQLIQFERDIQKAPKEIKNEYIMFVRKNKHKLKQLEKLFESGDWVEEKL